MLSIGIDVSKGKSTVCGMKPGGEIVYTPFEVQHTREGMSELVSLLRSSGEEVRVVLESTGSYHCPVVEFHAYLSPSKKFDTLDELRDCINNAAQRAQEYFK